MRTARAGCPPRARHGLARRLLGGHAQSREEGLAALGPREADEPGVGAGDRARCLERPREDGVQVDARADLPQLTGALGLCSRLLESRGEIAVKTLGPGERFPQELLDRGVGAAPPPDDHEQDDESRDEREARRADGYTDGDPRCAVADEKQCTCPESRPRSPAPTVTIIP